MKLKLFCFSILVLLFTSEIKAQFLRGAFNAKYTFETRLSYDYNPSTKVKGEIKEESMKFVVQDAGKELVITNANKVTKYEIQSVMIEELDKKDKKVKSVSLYLKDASPHIIEISDVGLLPDIKFYYSKTKMKIYSVSPNREMLDNYKQNLQRVSIHARYIRAVHNGEDDYYKLCTMCRGTGICVTCHGKKIIDDMFEQGKCSECSGTGHCDMCNGKGYFSN